MSKILKFGVIGLGFGAQVHVPALKMLSGVDVIAIAGKDIIKAKRLAQKLKVPMAFDNLNDFFNIGLDAVTIAVPPVESAKPIRMALGKGLAVLAEKPLANSFKTAKHLVQLAKDSITMMDFQFSEIVAFRKLKGLIDKGTYGKVRHVQLVWMVESAVQREKLWSWKTDLKRSGGVISLLGSHFLYLAEWMFGSLNYIYAETSSMQTAKFAPAKSTPAPDLVNIVAETKSGIRIAATIGNACPSGIGHRWEIVFDKGTAVLWNPTKDYMSGFSLVMRTSKKELIIVEKENYSFADGRLIPFYKLAQRFVYAIRNKKSVMPDFTVGARVQSLMEFVYKSAHRHKFIKVCVY